MIKRLAHVAPLQCGTVLAVLYALLGLVIFVPFLFLFSLIGASLPQQPNVPTFPAVAMGGSMIVMALIVPIFYGVFGFIAGVIAAFIYNLVAGWTGGLEFTTVDVPPSLPAQTANY